LCCTGDFIGNIPTEQHQVSGKFYIVDSKTIFIEDFNYDGGGPGTLTSYRIAGNLAIKFWYNII
jgi:hypothetical protein